MKKLLLSIVIIGAVLTTPYGQSRAYAQFDILKRLTQKEPPAEVVRLVPYFRLKGTLTETPVGMPPLFGNERPMSLKSLLHRLKTAREDSNVVGVVLDVQDAAIGLGQLEEIFNSVRKFAAVDKDVYVHADSLDTKRYALATSASHISIVPTGGVWLTGIYGENPYLRGTLDMIGVIPDIEHCGDFKSAGETLTRTGPSEQASEMTQWLIDSLYEGLVSLIAEGREITPKKVRQLIDNGPYSAEEALEAGLVDSVQHRQDFIADLEKRFGDSVEIDSHYAEDDRLDMPGDNFFAMFDFFMKMFNPSRKSDGGPSVAIVYVEGTIATGESEPSPFGGGSGGARSTTIRKALDEAAADDDVKAVVLRVDSPGGSALASEIILNAARGVAAKKPLIVSMGNVAASGGYYVTCASNTIFADKNTITASIGVIGGKLVTTGMWDKLGVNWHPIQRGEMAGLLSSSTRFSDKERIKIRHNMTTVYDIFKGHVTKARGKRLTKPIDELAAGRVFTGAQGLELGLVDKIGGLDDAVKFAAKEAGLIDFDLRVIPEPPTFLDMLMGRSKDENFSRMAANTGLSLVGLPVFKAALPILFAVDPLRAQAVFRALRRLELLAQEGVVVMMPYELLIR